MGNQNIKEQSNLKEVSECYQNFYKDFTIRYYLKDQVIESDENAVERGDSQFEIKLAEVFPFIKVK